MGTKFAIDHDLHIHSLLSACSNDPKQTAENILKYAEENRFSNICITDHFWDEEVLGASEWYAPQNFKHISQILPLPQSEAVRFHFGCETEMDKHMNIGISEKRLEELDFIIIPTTHLHMTGFTVEAEHTSVEKRAELYVRRLDRLLDMELPFHKIGIAHLTCRLISYNRATDKDEHLRIIDQIDDAAYSELFAKMAKKGAGCELNFVPSDYSEQDIERLLRPYKIAKAQGCKFYLGSDAHHPNALRGAMQRFEDTVRLLELEESDKFTFWK